MSRRRYISTEISVDKRINLLSDSAALLYTWMVPHASDDGTITSEPDEIKWTVMPGRRRTSAQISRAITEMVQHELLVDPGDGLLYFPAEAFYRYQTYIPPAKRRDFDPEQSERRETPKNTASPSPSPSLSNVQVALDKFDEFWNLYPRKEGKGKAKETFCEAAQCVGADEIIQGLQKQLPIFRQRERKFIPLPATWLNQERWADELEEPPVNNDIPHWSKDDFDGYYDQ